MQRGTTTPPVKRRSECFGLTLGFRQEDNYDRDFHDISALTELLSDD